MAVHFFHCLSVKSLDYLYLCEYVFAKKPNIHTPFLRLTSMGILDISKATNWQPNPAFTLLVSKKLLLFAPIVFTALQV